jgi:hypothetical protein
MRLVVSGASKVVWSVVSVPHFTLPAAASDLIFLILQTRHRNCLLVTSDMDFVPLINFLVQRKCVAIVAGFSSGHSQYHQNLTDVATQSWDLENLLIDETAAPTLRDNPNASDQRSPA